MKRALGWLPNPRDERDDEHALELSERLGSLLRGSTPSSDTLPYGTAYDQGGLGSCVGQMAAKMIEIDHRRQGIDPLVLASVLGIYNPARDMDGLLLWDTGTNIRNASEVLRKLGPIPESYFPYSDNKNPLPGLPAPYQQKPPTRGLMVAADANPFHYVLLQEIGEARVETVVRAINLLRKPVGFGTDVTAKFVADSAMPEVVRRPSKSDSLAGGHAMVIVGYMTMNGAIWLLVVNSWGARWNGSGIFWMHQDYLTWTRTRDLVVYPHVPNWKLAA